MRPYRPEQVLVADEEPHDVSGLLCVSFLRALRQPAGDGLVEEEVGSHDGGYCPEVHPVLPLPGDHLAEELQQGLRDTRTETGCETKGNMLSYYMFNLDVELHSLILHRKWNSKLFVMVSYFSIYY